MLEGLPPGCQEEDAMQRLARSVLKAIRLAAETGAWGQHRQD